MIEGHETITVIDVRAGKVFEIPLREVRATPEQIQRIEAERERARLDQIEIAEEPAKDEARARALRT